MSYSQYIERIIRLIRILKQEKTGTASSLSKKLNVSRRTVFRYLDELKLKGADICYSKERDTYLIKNDFNFKDHFF